MENSKNLSQEEKVTLFQNEAKKLFPFLEEKCRKIFDRRSLDDLCDCKSLISGLDQYYFPTPCVCMETDFGRIIGKFKYYMIDKILNNKVIK